MKNCLGIEIGHCRIKIAYMERGELKKYVSVRLDNDTLTDMKLYAEFIQDILRENNIHCKNVVFAMRQDDTYVKRCRLPLMSPALSSPTRLLLRVLSRFCAPCVTPWLVTA